MAVLDAVKIREYLSKEVFYKEEKIRIDPHPSNEEIGRGASLDIHISKTEKDIRKVDKAGEVIEYSEGLEPMDYTTEVTFEEDGYFTISPNDVVIAKTEEKIWLDKEVAAWMLNRHRVSAMGLSVSGFIHPMQDGAAPVQQEIVIHNIGPKEVKLKKGDSICQLIFFAVSNER